MSRFARLARELVAELQRLRALPADHAADEVRVPRPEIEREYQLIMGRRAGKTEYRRQVAALIGGAQLHADGGSGSYALGQVRERRVVNWDLMNEASRLTPEEQMLLYGVAVTEGPVRN